VEEKRQRIILEGDVPNPSHPPVGCNFNTRCPLARERCFRDDPQLKESEPGHFVACFAIEEGWA
jgi:oligopeptide/dipeptide ABC transporter ATP-binding protein